MSTAAVVIPPVSSAPAKHNKFIGFLDAFGRGLAKAFTFGVNLAATEEPVVDEALGATGNAALAGLFNQTVSIAQMAEAAAASAGANKAGVQKAAAVTTAILPSIQQVEQEFGVQVDAQKWNDAVVLALKAVTLAVVPKAS